MSIRIRRHRRVVGAFVALAAATALVLSGCASIPRGGAVAHGGSAQQDNGFGRPDFLPDGPFPGETQQQIVEGFIQAAVSPAGGYSTARSFLSTSFRNQWNPDAAAYVDTEVDRKAPVQLSQTEWSLTVTPSAWVNGTGLYLSWTTGQLAPLTFTFVKQDGQWRISKAPDGIVLDANSFTQVFSAYPLYFYSPNYRYLVPDQRWFPSASASVATRIVKALLAGPSKWLQGAVGSAFPNGTQLTGGGVPLQAGVAQVGLGSLSASVDPQAIDRMYVQLASSLVGEGPATEVDLSVNGLDRGENVAKPGLRDPGVDANPVVLKGGAFGPLAAHAPTQLPDLGKQVAELKPTAVTVGSGGQAAAALAAGKAYSLLAGGGGPRLVDDRSGLIAPALDPDGDIWTVAGDQPGAFRITPSTGDPVSFDVSWPDDGHSIASFGISRDGTRLAAVIRTSAGIAHVMVAGITRDASSGRPNGLTEPIDLGQVLPDGGSGATALTWVDELDVAVLGPDASGGTLVVTQPIGGISSTQQGPDGGVAISAGSGLTLWALSSGGVLSTSSGGGWSKKTDGVAVLATQLGRLS